MSDTDILMYNIKASLDQRNRILVSFVHTSMETVTSNIAYNITGKQ